MSKANKIYQELIKMYPEVYCELEHKDVYELVIAVALSAQATDVSVNKVTPKLFSKYPTIFDLANARYSDVFEIIKTIGLAPTKTKNIINLAKKVVEDKNGIIPSDYDYLITLPGVGRKTANVVLGEWFKVPTIPVDTHVLRVSNRLGLANTNKPIEVEKALMDTYNPDDWYGLHLRLIFFGRYFCKAKNPSCDICPFQDLCHYYTKKTP